MNRCRNCAAGRTGWWDRSAGPATAHSTRRLFAPFERAHAHIRRGGHRERASHGLDDAIRSRRCQGGRRWPRSSAGERHARQSARSRGRGGPSRAGLPGLRLGNGLDRRGGLGVQLGVDLHSQTCGLTFDAADRHVTAGEGTTCRRLAGLRHRSSPHCRRPARTRRSRPHTGRSAQATHLRRP